MPLLRDHARPGKVGGGDHRNGGDSAGHEPTTSAITTTTATTKTAERSGGNSDCASVRPTKKLGVVAKAVAATVVSDRQTVARAPKDTKNGKSSVRISCGIFTYARVCTLKSNVPWGVKAMTAKIVFNYYLIRIKNCKFQLVTCINHPPFAIKIFSSVVSQDYY